MINQNNPPDPYLIRFGRIQAGVRIHWIVFLAVNFGLFLINLLTGYWYPWHLWPLFCWGIGLLIHTSVSIISMKYESPRERAIRIHGSIYLVLIGILMLIGLVFFDRIKDLLWLLIPSIIFFLAWLNHYIAYHFLKPGQITAQDGSVRFTRISQRRMNYVAGMSSLSIQEANHRASTAIGNQIGFSYHFVNYFVLSIFFIFINLMTNSYSFWAIWPIASWGLVVMIHYHIAKMVSERALLHQEKRLYWLWFPGTLCLYLFIVDLISDKFLSWFLYPTIPIMILSLMIGGIVMTTRKVHIAQPSMISADRPPPSSYSPSTGISSKTPVMEPKTIQKMYCPNCGTEINLGTRFCPLCGSELPKE